MVNTSKEPISAEEVAKQLAETTATFQELLAKMERRLKAVEKSPALQQKRKAEDTTSDTRPAKRHKGSGSDVRNEPREQSPTKEKSKKKGKKPKKKKETDVAAA